MNKVSVPCKEDCSTSSCPFAFTDESEQIQNFGCLPTPFEIRIMRVEYGKTWACHSNPKKPCLGALNELRSRGEPYKVIDTLLTENDDWHKFVKPKNLDDLVTR